MPSPIHLSTSFGKAQGEAPPTRVCLTSLASVLRVLTTSSFMSDKIMPLSDAVEGYDIFDKMKAQKVVFTA